MTRAAEQILREALELDESDRATLAGLLIESLDDEQEEGWAEAWAAEIQRRAGQLDSVEVNTIPWEDVRARLLEKQRGASEI
ncbi:MAG TPA: addiction module protein [Rhodothermales bacterium]|nr:addiction module protein [Rhodothermales bacterium]